MALKDNSQEKWDYSKHTEVKHLLLEKYLKGWIVILGKFNDKIAYFDGFAGRGQYSDGSFGSPILAMKACQDVANVSSVRNLTYTCFFIEKNPDNYDNLVSIVNSQKSNFPSVSNAHCINGEFDDVINDILDKINNRLVPSFFFIDPFGYSGVPFSTIKRILSIPKTEVFFNFMARDINRFISLKNQENNLNRLYGNDSWKQFMELKGNERIIALRDLYMKRLLDENCAKYVWPFRICEDNRYATLYYLIYATNNFKGLDVMKGIMFKQNEHFAFLGPKEYNYQILRNQLKLFDNNIESLKEFLLKSMPKDIAFTYEKIKEMTYMDTPAVDKHYRAALKSLEKENKIRVYRITSKSSRGLSGNDKIIFLQN